MGTPEQLKLAKARRRLNFDCKEEYNHLVCWEHHHHRVPSLQELATGSVVRSILKEKIAFESWMMRLMDKDLAIEMKCIPYANHVMKVSDENGWIFRQNVNFAYMEYTNVRITKFLPQILNPNNHQVFRSIIYNNLRRIIQTYNYDNGNIYFEISNWRVSRISDICEEEHCDENNKLVYFDDLHRIGYTTDIELNGIKFLD